MTLNIKNVLNLDPAKFPLRKSTEYLVIHCTATPASMDIGSETVDRWHREQGWSAIGYHHVIRRDGTIERGRPLGSIGSHVKGYNNRSLGITLVGGSDRTKQRAEDNFTAYQYDALRELLGVLTRTYPDAVILGHRDLSPDKDGDGEVEPEEWLKSCPSFDARAWARKVGLAK
jgi:N-acetylmuramoyl-L-alanine amidase